MYHPVDTLVVHIAMRNMTVVLNFLSIMSAAYYKLCSWNTYFAKIFFLSCGIFKYNNYTGNIETKLDLVMLAKSTD